jgi:hypothetical protein
MLLNKVIIPVIQELTGSISPPTGVHSGLFGVKALITQGYKRSIDDEGVWVPLRMDLSEVVKDDEPAQSAIGTVHESKHGETLRESLPPDVIYVSVFVNGCSSLKIRHRLTSLRMTRMTRSTSAGLRSGV